MRLVDRRIGLLFAIFILLFGAAVARAAWLGGVKADDLQARAASQQEATLIVPAKRGTIVDRDGVELAVSEDAATVVANPFLIADPAGTAAAIGPLIGRPPEDVLADLSQPGRGFVYLARRIDPSAGQEVKSLSIEGIDVLVEPRRAYPQGEMASQLIGAVGTDGYGLAGLEQSLEERLHGSDGERHIVKDALGKPISIDERALATAGEDVELTLDTTIQAKVDEVVAEVGKAYSPEGVTAVVADPRSGEIIALSNWPPVDPDRFGDASDYNRQNRVVAASYEPGSTFKAFTISGALEDGLVDPSTEFGLAPTIQVADRTIKESHGRGAVTLSVAEILAQSSNVGAVTIGLQLGAKRFDHWSRKFGFGKGTGVDIPGEGTGITLRPEEYSGSTMGNLPIGQGLAVTPMQLVRAYSAIANGGIAMTPHVVEGADVKSKRVVSKRTANEVSRMLEGVLSPGGTASEATIEGYHVAGKTGTAQKPDGFGGYSDSAFVGSFVGYAPARKPRLLVAIAVDEPQGSYYGGVVAAPAFEKIMEFALPYLRIPPD